MIDAVGVIGAGTMGAGIAQVCAAAGLRVCLVDVSQAALARGQSTIVANLERMVSNDKLTSEQKDATLQRIVSTTDYVGLRDAKLVIEAATESLELKLKILQQLDMQLAKDAIIATNTSSLSITQLAAVVTGPERFIGMHFFNPVPRMALIELIRGLQTSDDTHASALAFTKQIGKNPVTAKNSPGFAINRILCPMINEAIFALQEGVMSAKDIDDGMKLGCNHPIGPLALADMIGLDTLLAIMDVFYEGFKDPKYRAAPLLKEMVAAGYLGRKSGRGFFQYK